MEDGAQLSLPVDQSTMGLVTLSVRGVERALRARFDEPVNESIRQVRIAFTADLMPA